MKRVLFLLLCLPLRASAQTVPFDLRDGFLIVSRCSVGTLPNLVAVVDTGVTETTLDLRIAKRLALSMRPDAATVGTRSAVIQEVSIPNIEFGPLHSESLTGIAADLSPLTYQMGIRPDVLIGMDLLELKRFVIDYRTRTITFGESPSFKYSTTLVLKPHLALLDLTADGKTLRLQLDTGFNAILVYGGKLRGSPSQELDSHAAGFGLRVQAQPAYIRQAQIGNWRSKSLTAYVTDESPSTEAGFDGLLGPKALGIRRLAIDLESQTLSWE